MLENRTLIKLREDFSDQAHKSWAGWMQWVFENGTMNPDGTFTINADKVGRWQRQINTEYPDLSEQEKNSDRIEADKFLEILFDSGVCLEKHADDYAKVKGFWRESNV